jgi:hypothetical protein
MTSRTLTVSSAPRARREPWVAHEGCALSRSLDVLITGNSPRQHRPRARSRGANAHRSYGAQWTPAPRRRCRGSGASAPVRCPRTISPPACTSALSQAGAARAAGHRRDRSPAQLQERDEHTVRRRRSRGSRATGGASLEASKSAQTSTSLGRQTASATSATPISSPARPRGRRALDRVGGAVSSGSTSRRTSRAMGTSDAATST